MSKLQSMWKWLLVYIVTCRPTINASFIFSMLTSNNKGMNCEINEAYAIGIW